MGDVLTEQEKVKVLEKMASRTKEERLASDRILLTGPEGEDIGEEYWIILRGANAKEMAKLGSAGIRETTPMSALTGQTEGEEIRVEHRFDIFGIIDAVAKLNLITDACIPKLVRKEVVPYTLTKTDLRDKKWLNDISPGLIPGLLSAINEFYFPQGEEEVAAEVKNLPTSTELSASEMEEAPSST